MSRGFPLYRQLDARDCGPACLRMIGAWYGKVFPLPDLRDYAEVDREGASMEGLAAAAESMGLEALPVRIPLQGDQSLVSAPLPCILHWEQRHFVVLYRIAKGRFYIADPAKGRYTLKKEAFRERWQGNAPEGIALLLEPGAFFDQVQPRQEQRLGWGFIWQYLKPYRAMIRQLILGLIVMSGIQLVLPFLTKAVVDLGIGNGDIGLIWILLLGQLFLVIGQTGALFFQNWIFLHLGTRFNLSLLNTFLRKLMNLPLRFFDQRLMGDLLNRIQDHHRIEVFITQASLSLVLSVVQLFIFGIVLIFFHPGIFGIFLVATILYFSWFLLFWHRRAVVDAERFEKNSENQHALVELIQGMPEIKLQGSARKRRRAWAKIQVELFRVNLRGLRIGQWQDGGTTLIAQAKDVAILLVAAFAVIDGKMTLGSLLAIQFIIGQLNVPLRQIVSFLRRAQDARISLERFGEIHQLPEESAPEQDVPEALRIWREQSVQLEARAVSFAYSRMAPPVLQDLNFVVPAGKLTAIVGASGSGKTTLLKMLLGFYEPGEGQLFLGELPFSAIPKEWWRSRCGAVLQDGFIFSDTIAQNIAESAEEPDETRLRKAIQTACLAEFITQQPNGWQTVIGARGNSLSQGQRQRVLIARAVYRNPDVLFFDEATNALDAGTERRILENLRTFFRGRTVIFVAHRLSTVMAADQILVLDGGHIAERGTHQELIAQKGAYYELVRDQLELNK
jgi:ATP-binding cassette subfamily B protein